MAMVHLFLFSHDRCSRNGPDERLRLRGQSDCDRIASTQGRFPEVKAQVIRLNLSHWREWRKSSASEMPSGTAIAHHERHRSQRTGWLRAAVLGANDGVVSTASLLLGVSAAHASRRGILVTGVSGLAAGAMAMAAGEYVSVSSQADTQRADLAVESEGLATDREAEREELAAIYVERGLDANLAKEVANQLMAHDALAAHARDEIGISETLKARPLQAALASAASFTIGAAVPLLTAALVGRANFIPILGGVSLAVLALMGGLAALVGGARITVGALRVLFWGALAMSVTVGIGAFVGSHL
jgi:VIT1/CCC1 family predicted Fe2+/Mn2+ transporter